MMRKFILTMATLVITLVLSVASVNAVDVTLSVNAATGSAPWFISGEPSLVMNGFDVTRLGVTLPATVRSISIDVSSTVTGTVEAVAYQDADGGSPSNATLIGRKQVTIGTTGVFTVTFDTTVTLSQPVLWVGFYLPVDFRFNADTQGASVLTYWAWTPGTTFDLNNLASASVLGPANGTAPVNINMNGVARITAVVSTNATTTPTTTTATPVVVQGTAGNVDTNLLTAYNNCGTVFYDRADLEVTLRGEISLVCRVTTPNDRFNAAPPGYTQSGFAFGLTAYSARSGIASNTRFRAPVTHCIAADASAVATGIIGLADPVTRNWRLLATQRVGNLVCAEVPLPGFLAVFFP